ncbi:hypothetical protein AYI69_g6498 [Smittium culicis]|uniref:Uncharacterized protein n=1 Tax=Smittium culicis TaxID=133412 RepID=A0A1R1XYK3_9FUNG|nr:hypothetical protein AYI69_g6498 [Smittium culicis]
MYLSDMLNGKDLAQYSQTFIRILNWYNHFLNISYICTISSILYSGISFYKRSALCKQSDSNNLERYDVTEQGIIRFSCSDYFDFNISYILSLSLAITVPILVIPLCYGDLSKFSCQLLSEKSTFIVNFLIKDLWTYLASIFAIFSLYTSLKNSESKEKTLSSSLTEKDTEKKQEYITLISGNGDCELVARDLESMECDENACCKRIQTQNYIAPWFTVAFLTIIIPSITSIAETLSINSPVIDMINFISPILTETKGVYILCALLSMPKDERVFE